MILANITALPFMAKKESKEVLDIISKMGEVDEISKVDVEADRNRLRRILKGKMV